MRGRPCWSKPKSSWAIWLDNNPASFNKALNPSRVRVREEVLL